MCDGGMENHEFWEELKDTSRDIGRQGGQIIEVRFESPLVSLFGLQLPSYTGYSRWDSNVPGRWTHRLLRR